MGTLTGSPAIDTAIVAGLFALAGVVGGFFLNRRTAREVLDRTLGHQRNMARDEQTARERLERLKFRTERRERRVQPLRDALTSYMHIAGQLLHAEGEQPRDLARELDLVKQLKALEDILVRVSPAVTNSVQLREPVRRFSQAGTAYARWRAGRARATDPKARPETWLRGSVEDPEWQALLHAVGALDEAIDLYIEAGDPSSPD